MTRRRFLIATVVAVALFAAAITTRAHWGPPFARYLDVGGRPERVDYAVVLAGDVQTRPLAAAILYRHGYVKKILLTRPPRHGDSPAALESTTELARRILLHEGVKPDDVRILDGDVHTTMDEARLVAPLVRAESQAKFVVVTNDYHTRRGLWSLQHAAPEGAARITAFSAPTKGATPADWQRSQVGLVTYFTEYARLAFYHLRYGEGVFVVAMVLIGIGSLWMLLRVLRRRRTL